MEGAPLGPQEVVWWVSSLGNQKAWLLRLTGTTNPTQDIYAEELKNGPNCGHQKAYMLMF